MSSENRASIMSSPRAEPTASVEHVNAADDIEDDFQGRYSLLEKIGEGTYGLVYRAICMQSSARVAIKKIKILNDDEGVPTTALREIALLKECENYNVIKLFDVHNSRCWLYLVFECLDMDLRVYIKRHGALRDAWLRSAVYQCFNGLQHCHERRMLHRDLKPQNILVDTKAMRIVLADFGLARNFSYPVKVYTHEVVTLWYRAPELLLGQGKYGPPMDVWSLGCIMAEAATATALFPGDSEIDTIFKIFRVMGTPSDEVWPGVTTLKDMKTKFPKWQDTGFAEVRRLSGGALGEDGMDMLASCLRYDLVQRPSAKQALRHPFLEAAPERQTMKV